MPRALGPTSSKMTRERMDRMIQASGQLCTRSEIAKIGGIHRKTLWEWMTRGEEEIKKLDEERPDDWDDDELSIYATFYMDMERAAALKGEELLTRIDEASKDPANWAAAMTLLERRYPDQWGRRSRDGRQTRRNPVQAVVVFKNRDGSVSGTPENVRAYYEHHGYPPGLSRDKLFHDHPKIEIHEYE